MQIFKIKCNTRILNYQNYQITPMSEITVNISLQTQPNYITKTE